MTDHEDRVTSLTLAEVRARYPAPHVLYTLAYRAASLAEHPAVHDVLLRQRPDSARFPIVALNVILKVNAAPIDEVLGRYGRAIAEETGLQYEGVLPRIYPDLPHDHIPAPDEPGAMSTIIWLEPKRGTAGHVPEAPRHDARRYG